MLRIPVLCGYFLIFALQVSSGLAGAEEDSFDRQVDSGYQGAEPENEIIRWCSDRDQSMTRYASANISLAGWSPCGQLETIAYCDSTGRKRYLRPTDAVPYSYRPCSEGPRIFVKVHDRVMYLNDDSGNRMGVDEYTEKLGSTDDIVDSREIGMLDFSDPLKSEAGLRSGDSTQDLVTAVKNLADLAPKISDVSLPTPEEGLSDQQEASDSSTGEGMLEKLQGVLRSLLPE